MLNAFLTLAIRQSEKKWLPNKILLFFTSTVAKLEQKFKNENLCQKQQLLDI